MISITQQHEQNQSPLTSLWEQQHDDEMEEQREVVLVPAVTNEKDVDALLANELNKLSIQERENVFEEIHGVDHVVNESEEFIQRSLIELSKELDKIPIKPAYNYIALSLSSSSSSSNNNVIISKTRRDYIHSRKFRLMFLRYENFHIDKAATRLVNYMEGMLQYFGPNVLGRPLYYDDLCLEAQNYIKSGVDQLLPQERDTTGRAILFHDYRKAETMYSKPQSLVQSFLYLLYCAIENNDMTQTRGLVLVAYCCGTMEGEFNCQAHKQVSDAQRYWFPIKIQAMHVVFDDPRMKLVQPLSWISMGPLLRQRVRVHVGTHTEILYQLMSFGLPVDAFPLNFKGNLKTIAHQKWIKRRLTKESAMKGFLSNGCQPLDSIIESPAINDVVLWRGRIYQQHPGNIRMRSLVEQYSQQYNDTPLGGKKNISMKIVSTIKYTHRGRFLTQDPGGWWVEVSDKEAERKVSKSFRSSRATTTYKPSSSSNATTPALSSDGDGPLHTKDSLPKKNTKALNPSSRVGNKRLRVTSSHNNTGLSVPNGGDNCCLCPRTFTASPRPDKNFAN